MFRGGVPWAVCIQHHFCYNSDLTVLYVCRVKSQPRLEKRCHMCSAKIMISKKQTAPLQYFKVEGYPNIKFEVYLGFFLNFL